MESVNSQFNLPTTIMRSQSSDIDVTYKGNFY